jgi:hypothetical protein
LRGYELLAVPSLAAQRRQSDSGGIEAAIYGQNLSGDVAGAVAAQEEHRFRQFFFEAVAVERDRVVIVGADFRGKIDRATHFERCWRGSDWIERHALERIVVEDNEAFVTYQCVAKGGKAFRNTEVFLFEGDRVKRIDVYFGATYQNGAFVRQSES